VGSKWIKGTGKKAVFGYKKCLAAKFKGWFCGM